MKRWLSLGLLLFFFLFSPTLVWAADFLFDYDVSFVVSETGVTQVEQIITITNKVSNFYVPSFTQTIFSEHIESITAKDAEGTIVPEVHQANGQTIIQVPFHVKTVGLDKQSTFTLGYASRDIAVKKGKIWEIIIPGIARDEAIQSLSVRLSVPKSFGTASFVSPPTQTSNKWTLDQLGGGGILAIYGESQDYTFSLQYTLENISGKTEFQEIALPPDTAHQKVLLRHLSELPEYIYTDADGNWLAQYRLESKQTKHILAEGAIITSTKADSAFKKILTSEQKNLYTQPQMYWERTPEIIQKAKELGTPRAIYNYVIATLTYNYQRIGPGISRLGAAQALAQPTNAVCMEFSDLFVALARAAGIPAREIHGFAYTTNEKLQPLSRVSDVLHAWPEYFDEHKQLWVPVDPTWGDTTQGINYFDSFDLNHITFAVLGTKSDAPFPAGSYKKDPQSKDVYVDFAKDTLEIPLPEYTLDIPLPTYIYTGKNKGIVAFSPAQFDFRSPFEVAMDPLAATLVPPYGIGKIPLTISVPFDWWFSKKTLNFEVSGLSISKEVTIVPSYFKYTPYVLLGSCGLLLIFAILVAHGKSNKSN